MNTTSFNKKAVILNGSPRRHGNTAALLEQLEKALHSNSWQTARHNLYTLNFKGCSHCDACQKVLDKPGCILNDDLKEILDAIADIETKLIVIASPIYCWSVSGCASAALDRFYALMKGGSEKSLIAGKKIIGAFTSGGSVFDGMDLCASMLRQLCAFGGTEFAGVIAAPHCTTPQELLTRRTLHNEIMQSIAVI